MNKKGLHTIVVQMLVPMLVFMIIFLIIDSVVLYKFTSEYVTKNQYKATDILAKHAVIEMEDYECLGWLLDYWENHYPRMEYVYNNKKLLDEKDSDFRSRHPEILEYADVTDEVAEGLTDLDQKLFAEICYCMLSKSFDRIKSSQEPVYLYSFKIRNDNEMFIFVTGTMGNERRISSGGELFELGIKDSYKEGVYPVLDKVAKTGKAPNLIEKSLNYGADHGIVHAFRPIYANNKMVGILGVGLSSKQLSQMGYKVSANMIVISAVLFIINVIIVMIILVRVVIRPIKLEKEIIEQYEHDKDALEVKRNLSKIKFENELTSLAVSFSSMATELDRYIDEVKTITAEKERIGAELNLATRIQANMLPNIYPAFPDRKEFDIYGTMTPAKEVGGDFYDFFLIDDDHLCIVIADVSGKGVPAALFMMASKIMLANNAMSGKSPAQILQDTNNAICANNKEEMFVTVWLGILDISTGKIIAANAGHEYPIIQNQDGTFELFKDKHGFVVGAMSGMKYIDYEFTLAKGAKLFVYTDGVTEATNVNKELFGMDRVVDTLNQKQSGKPVGTLENMKNGIDMFVKEAEQFDDITMLCLEYYGE